MLRFIAPFLLFTVIIGHASTAVPLPVFRISSPGKDWRAVENPMPGVQTVYLKGKDAGDGSITVLKDTTAALYGDLNTYMDHALRIVREQRQQKILGTKEFSSARAGHWRLVRSEKGSTELLQAVFHRPGLGFYVVTGTFPRSAAAKGAKDFERALAGAAFHER